MLHGGDKLVDNYLIDLVEKETKESLQKEAILHEEFFGFLIENEME
jgi:hypothetical protein